MRVLARKNLPPRQGPERGLFLQFRRRRKRMRMRRKKGRERKRKRKRVTRRMREIKMPIRPRIMQDVERSAPCTIYLSIFPAIFGAYPNLPLMPPS
jgi:hypothetical protein